MKKAIYLVLISAVFVSFTNMKYVAHSLWYMALSADKIVYGEITELTENDYILKITTGVTDNSGTINIQRFQDWTCASRWAPYKRGQMVMLFLEKRNDTYHIMSGGGEGEMQIDKNVVKLPEQTIQCEVKSIKPDLEITKFLKIITQLRNCYGINKKIRDLPYKKTTCKDENLYSDKNANSLYLCLKKEIEQKFKE